MKISIGADHGGFLYKEYIKKILASKYNILDRGAFIHESNDNYTDFAFRVAEDVASKKADLGIMICRTAVGASIAMNKVKGIRAGLCESVKSAKLARQKNDINILTFGADNISKSRAIKIIEKFLTTNFDGGRHAIRVNTITEYEGKN